MLSLFYLFIFFLGLFQANQPIKYNGEHRLNVEEKKPRSAEGIRGGSGRGSVGRGGGGQGMAGRAGGQTYGDRGGPGGRGGIKSGSGFNSRQDIRGSPNLGPRGGLSQQGRR